MTPAVGARPSTTPLVAPTTVPAGQGGRRRGSAGRRRARRALPSRPSIVPGPRLRQAAREQLVEGVSDRGGRRGREPADEAGHLVHGAAGAG